MRILVFHSVLAKFFGEVCRDIQQHHTNIELYGIVTGHSFRRRVKEGGAFWTSLTSFSDALRAQPLNEPYDLPFLQEMEAQYGRPNLYLFAHGDWFTKDFPHHRMMRFLEIAFRFLLEEWERINRTRSSLKESIAHCHTFFIPLRQKMAGRIYALAQDAFRAGLIFFGIRMTVGNKQKYYTSTFS